MNGVIVIVHLYFFLFLTTKKNGHASNQQKEWR
jgi:heme/copper-type cytochrome/quinol oxidase subunit 4